jgi:YD repeat-containing protein
MARARKLSRMLQGGYDVARPACCLSAPRNRGASRSVALLCGLLALLLAGIGRVSADSAQYFYDPAGRLIAVVDPVNGSAQYSYDGVGNILSVVRKSITDIMVAQVSPSGAAAGTAVTISGTGFGTTSDTTVSFNGQPATPTAVSATQITIAVPSGATTGPVSVTSPAGTAASAASFVVQTTAAPAISGVSPGQTDQGSTVTVSGSGFDPAPNNNKVFVNGRYARVSAATASSLTVVVPAAASGRVTVATANGSATNGSYLVVPPLPYVASSIGAVVNSAIGNSPSVSVGTAGQIGLILFDATAGQRVAIQVTASSFGSATLALYGPDGAQIGGSPGISAGTFFPSQSLSQGGTYTVVIAPGSSSTGAATINLLSPPDVTATIAANATPVSLTTTQPGQRMVLTFSGTAGQKVFLASQVGSGLTSSCSPFTFMHPDGATQLYRNDCFNNSSNYSGGLVLPVTGTYTLVFNPNGTTTGTATFTLYNVPPDATGTISTNATPVSLTTTTPGQNMSLTFIGSASQRIFLFAQFGSGLTPSCGPFTIVLPDGTTQLYYNSCFNYSTNNTGVLVLPAAGTYTIFYSSAAADTGTATFTLYNVPADVSGTITIGGGSVSLTTTTPGQAMSLTFSGAAGQTIGLQSQISSGLVPGCSPLTIVQPHGTTQLYNNSCWNYSTNYSGLLTLPVSGTYTISFKPNGTTFGTATMSLFAGAPDVIGTITPGGSAVSLTTTTAGQNMRLTFTGSAGQKVSLYAQFDSGLTPGCGPLTIVEPDGTTQLYSNGCFNYSTNFSGVLVLPAAGTYTILFKPPGADTGTATYTLYNEPADASGTITPGGGSVSLTTTTPGQNMSLTFAGTAGHRISLFAQFDSGLTPRCSPLTIVQPDGTTQLFSDTCFNYSTNFTEALPQPVSGTYTISFIPNGTTTGTATFTLYDVPADVTGSTSIGQVAANYTTTVPGQAIQVTFAGTSGQSVTVQVGVVSGQPANPCYRVTTLNPDATTLRGDQTCSTSGYSSGSLSLAQNGTYKVVIAPKNAATGTFSLAVSTP